MFWESCKNIEEKRCVLGAEWEQGVMLIMRAPAGLYCAVLCCTVVYSTVLQPSLWQRSVSHRRWHNSVCCVVTVGISRATYTGDKMTTQALSNNINELDILLQVRIMYILLSDVYEGVSSLLWLLFYYCFIGGYKMLKHQSKTLFSMPWCLMSMFL